MQPFIISNCCKTFKIITMSTSLECHLTSLKVNSQDEMYQRERGKERDEEREREKERERKRERERERKKEKSEREREKEGEERRDNA